MRRPPRAAPPCRAAAPRTALGAAAAAFGVPQQPLRMAVLCEQQRGLQQSAAQRPPPHRQTRARDRQRRRPAPGRCRRRGSRSVHGSRLWPPASRHCRAPRAAVLKQQQRTAVAHPRCDFAYRMPAGIAYGVMHHLFPHHHVTYIVPPLARQSPARPANAEPASSVSSRGAWGAPASKQHGASCSPGDQTPLTAHSLCADVHGCRPHAGPRKMNGRSTRSALHQCHLQIYCGCADV